MSDFPSLDKDEWDELLGLFNDTADLESAGTETASEGTLPATRGRRKRNPTAITPDMQAWMVRLPFHFCQLRNSGDRGKIRSFLNEYVAPNATMDTGNSTIGELQGTNAILKVIANEFNVYPDSLSVVEQSYLQRSFCVVSKLVFKGTRTDRVSGHPMETTEEGHDLHNLYFGSEELTRAQVLENKIKEGTKRAFSENEIEQIRALEGKVLEGKALAQFEVATAFRWLFKLEAGETLPRIVRIEARTRFRDISVYPLIN